MVRSPIVAPVPQQEPVNLVRSSLNPLAGGNRGIRWQNGITYLPDENIVAGVTAQCTPTDHRTHSPQTPKPPIASWDPYLAWAGVQCSTFGWQGYDWSAAAQRALELATPKALEREFWAGDGTKLQNSYVASSVANLYLAMPAVSQAQHDAGNFGPVDLTPGGGPVSIKRGFAMLEQAIADAGAGARGMIHARPEATPDFTGVRREGSLLLTQNDTIVVPGAGYPNIGPGGDPASPLADGTTWIFATGVTQVWIEPTTTLVPDPADPNFYAQAVDKDVNLLTAWANRLAMVTWSGQVHYAVHCNLPT